VHVCVGGVFGKGHVYRVHWVSVKAERTISVLRIRRESDPEQILARGSEVCVKCDRG
jgi:hypothetical protein